MARVLSLSPRPVVSRALWVVTLLLLLIAVAMVTRRGLRLTGVLPPPTSFPEASAMDAGFSRHPVLTALHMLPGLSFLLLGTLQFVPAIRNRWRRFHRWSGRIAIPAGVIAGVTAMVMTPQMAIGGENETAAAVFFGLLFLFALAKGFGAIRRRDIAAHREWMIRAYAIGLAVALVRPIVGVFFAIRPLSHLAPHEFFGTAFWLGFSIAAVAAESWINYTRARPLRS